MGFSAAGLAVIAGAMAVTGTSNPFSATKKGFQSSIGIKSPLQPGAPPVMPDQSSILQSSQLQAAKDASLQYGRAATVLTGTGASSTTGDKLGP